MLADQRRLRGPTVRRSGSARVPSRHSLRICAALSLPDARPIWAAAACPIWAVADWRKQTDHEHARDDCGAAGPAQVSRSL
jgi:hypothetical protein